METGVRFIDPLSGENSCSRKKLILRIDLDPRDIKFAWLDRTKVFTLSSKTDPSKSISFSNFDQKPLSYLFFIAYNEYFAVQDFVLPSPGTPNFDYIRFQKAFECFKCETQDKWLLEQYKDKEQFIENYVKGRPSQTGLDAIKISLYSSPQEIKPLLRLFIHKVAILNNHRSIDPFFKSSHTCGELIIRDIITKKEQEKLTVNAVCSTDDNTLPDCPSIILSNNEIEEILGGLNTEFFIALWQFFYANSAPPFSNSSQLDDNRAGINNQTLAPINAQTNSRSKRSLKLQEGEAYPHAQQRREQPPISSGASTIHRSWLFNPLPKIHELFQTTLSYLNPTNSKVEGLDAQQVVDIVPVQSGYGNPNICDSLSHSATTIQMLRCFKQGLKGDSKRKQIPLSKKAIEGIQKKLADFDQKWEVAYQVWRRRINDEVLALIFKDKSIPSLEELTKLLKEDPENFLKRVDVEESLLKRDSRLVDHIERLAGLRQEWIEWNTLLSQNPSQQDKELFYQIYDKDQWENDCERIQSNQEMFPYKSDSFPQADFTFRIQKEGKAEHLLSLSALKKNRIAPLEKMGLLKG